MLANQSKGNCCIMTLCHAKIEYFEGILKTKTVLDAGKA